MVWDFSSLTLAGIVPETSSTGATFVPFSGSLLTEISPVNSDFKITPGSILGYNPESLQAPATNDSPNPPYVDAPTMGSGSDGSIMIQWNGDDGGNNRGVSVGIAESTGFTEYTNIQFLLSCKIEATTNANFEVEFVQQRWYPTINGYLDEYQNVLYEFESDTSTGIAELNNNTIFWNDINGAINDPSSTIDWYYSRFFFRIKNNETSTINYTFEVSDFSCKINYVYQNQNRTFPTNGTFVKIFDGFFTGDGYQNGTNKALPSGIADYYNQCVVDAYLKRTGSQGDFVITSSVWPNGGYSGSIHSGSIINFDGTNGSIASSPITAFNDVDFTADTTTTRANPGDLYYIEYQFKDFKKGVFGGIETDGQFIDFQSAASIPEIEITATGNGGAAGFGLTGSVLLRRSNLIPLPLDTGVEVINMEFLRSDDETAIGAATVIGEYNGTFNANDIHRFSVQVEKEGPGSGLVITEFTASIFPGQSIFSPITLPNAYGNYRTSLITEFLVPTYYAGALPFELALDCQPLLNNFILQRPSEFIMDVDYNNQSGSITPINQEQILENTAVKAAVPDSNYSSLRSINPRYNGVKSTSAKLNVWSVGDFGTYGQNPTVELRDAYFGYFNDLDDPYPNINGLTRVNLSYLVDEQGNALPPSLEPITIDTFNAVFPNTTVGKLAVRDINSKYQQLGSPSPISRTMEYVTPICYSQNSGENYANKLPLSGSGYISRYDNDDANGIDFGKFTAVGPTTTLTADQTQSVSYVLDPQNATKSPDVSENNLPYDISDGVISYPSSTWGTAGDDLNNEQIISVQTSIVTSHVSETRTITDELKLHFQMKYSTDGSTNFESTPFNLEYIDCKVYTDTGQVYLIKNVDEYGWFKYTNIDNTQNLGPRYNSNLDRWTTSRVNVPASGIRCSVAYEMSYTLFELGLMREREPKNGSGVLALEWIFSANSGKKSIKANGGIKYTMSGSITDVRGGWQQGFFFPQNYPGEYTPTKIQGAGTLDHLLAEANQAEAPFWQFSGSYDETIPGYTFDYSFIEMSSSNFNEAYGTGYYQGDLPYIPGTSQYFPGNVEPKTTAFDPIENPLEFQENDEIRFGNNENFTYRVLEVFAPQENVSSSAEGDFAKVKLKLDKPVDTSINKDFFLVRRKVVNPNSLYLDTPFPYGILSSGSISQVIMNTGSNSFALSGSVDANGLYTASISNLELATTPGILFPDFPTEYLTKSASMIVNDLISKGVIES
jgi:hypothetical protein